MTIETKSIWEDTSRQEMEFPAISKNTETDVAIVGGGITGITAAYLLARAGKKVVVLEARRIGLGTTGNSTGNLYSTVDEHLSHIRKKWNDDVMKAVVQSRSAALNLVEENVRKLNIDCSFSRQPFTYFAEKPNAGTDQFLQDELEALKVAGLAPVLHTDAGLPYQTVSSLRIEGQAQLHPLQYVRQLAKAIPENCTIFENSRVKWFDPKKGIVDMANGTKVKARHIILATHTPIGVHTVQSLLGPYREFGIAAELKEGTFPGGIFWGLDEPKHSIRSFTSSGKTFVMVVGDKFKTGQHNNTQAYILGLERYLRERLPVGKTRYVWGGQQYRPADSLPYIGRHNESLYIATGFATDGLIYGTLGAMILTDLINGKANPWANTFDAGRFTPIRSARDFIAENTDVLTEYLKDTPWHVDAGSLDEIKPGEGKVIGENMEKMAVYKDENGKTHIVSAVCTHMKCVVNWNPSEKSWDCPCHGSRFTYEGKVIEGPATVDLPAKRI